MSKAMGPDNVNPKLLYVLSENKGFVAALTDLFRKCYGTNQLPSVWKTANIIPLHKKDSKQECCNYRPISLT